MVVPGISRKHRQQGMMLIMLIFIIGLASTAYLVNAMSQNIQAERNTKTAIALAKAKAALIGWSAGNDSTVITNIKPGTLPCTDTTNSGSAVTSGSNACAAYLGRLPWKQLGMDTIRDANQECLWYVLSPIFRNTMNNGTRASNPLASATGSITIKNSSGTVLATDVLALIISPGAALSGQNHSSSTDTVCGGNSTTANYLENYDEANLVFVSDSATNTFNDKLIAITREDLYLPLRKRLVREMMGNVAVPSGLYKYYTNNAQYPCPANTMTGSQNCVPPYGAWLPYNDMDYTQIGSWLERNNWYSLAAYTYNSATSVNVRLSGGTGSTQSCTASSAQVTCTYP
jgi:hypothetical protein